jgi:pyrimidine-specific ribonucleoside hydrolase
MNKKQVWIDTDLSVGMKRYHREGYSDVDDGYAVLQLFKADNVHIAGLSSVFGNTKIEDAHRLSLKMVQEFAPYEISVYKGAAGRLTLENIETNDAVEAMAEALKKTPLHIMAIGPATNVGILLLLYPELKSQVKELVLVAGRRTATSYFEIGSPVRHAPDLNFDLDNDAFRVLLESGVKIVLCPFEISNKVWLTGKDINRLKNGDAGNEWLADASQEWLQQWLDAGSSGFNPFDVLASHYLIHPEDIIIEERNAHLEIHPNDMLLNEPGNNFKSYLLCDDSAGHPVYYCYDVVADYHQRLMQTLLK